MLPLIAGYDHTPAVISLPSPSVFWRPRKGSPHRRSLLAPIPKFDLIEVARETILNLRSVRDNMREGSHPG
jgi:hypothetical protein